jgi:hypothetical protein
MSHALAHIEFSTKFFGDGKWPDDLNELVDGWIARFATREAEKDDELLWVWTCTEDLCRQDPGLGLDFVLEVLKKDPPPDTAGVLAAGPLEDLLADSGPAIIERVEAEARRDLKFRRLLKGVWRSHMQDDIWERINQLRSE